ncbi:Hypothetical predicted protein [Olea europaea subsp. europaea]|uniref:Lipin middle domain-containing protein n=1 Tax=Olea europaea subsp. europaea TaxID=158383 RepID=A0A8S0U0X5_OLEEU|nr:Hypothetical predicted protein [Olea europaea subsp. europaea]
MDADLVTKGECSKSAHLHPHSTDSSGDMNIDFHRGIEISLRGYLLHAGVGLSATETFDGSYIAMEEFKVSTSSIVKNENLLVRMQGKYLKWNKTAPIILGIAAYGLDLLLEEDESGLTSTPSGWRLWPIPIRRVKILEYTGSNSSNEEVCVDSESISESQHVEPTPTPRAASESSRKQVIGTNVHTTDQIVSLNLEEGRNMVNFIFAIWVLGSQKVEAHIYLWKHANFNF